MVLSRAAALVCRGNKTEKEVAKFSETFIHSKMKPKELHTSRPAWKLTKIHNYKHFNCSVYDTFAPADTVILIGLWNHYPLLDNGRKLISTQVLKKCCWILQCAVYKWSTDLANCTLKNHPLFLSLSPHHVKIICLFLRPV